MAKPNPFQVIGIDARALRGKSDEQIKKLAQLIGRAVMQVEHPDAGGNGERFKAVQNALDELKDDEKFIRSKQRLLEPVKTQLARVSEELERCKSRTRAGRKQLRAYLESLVTDGASAFKSENIQLQLLDTVLHEQRGGIHSRNPAFFSLAITSNGVIETREGSSRQVARVPIGCVPKSAIQVGGIKWLMQRCHPQVTPTEKHRRRLKTSDIDVRPTRIDRHRSPWQLADPVLALLRPVFERDAYLFSLSVHNGEPYLYLEGLITRLEAVGSQ